MAEKTKAAAAGTSETRPATYLVSSGTSLIGFARAQAEKTIAQNQAKLAEAKKR